MKTLSLLLLSAALVLGAAVEPVFASGGHFRGGHFRGGHFVGHRFAGHRFGGHHAFRHHAFRGFRHHSRASVSLFLGAPLFFDPFFDPFFPPVYSSPTVVVPASPPVYIEREPEQAYWYYCRESRAYYPYVKECPGPWQRVVPEPPPPS